MMKYVDIAYTYWHVRKLVTTNYSEKIYIFPQDLWIEIESTCLAAERQQFNSSVKMHC